MTPTEPLRALHAKTPQAKWFVVHDAAHPSNMRLTCRSRPHIGKIYGRDLGEDVAAADTADWIAAAHEHWLPLLDEIDRLRGEGPSEEEVARIIAEEIRAENGAFPGYTITARRVTKRLLALRSSGPMEEIRPSADMMARIIRDHMERPDTCKVPCETYATDRCGCMYDATVIAQAIEAASPTEEIRGSDSDVEKPMPSASSAAAGWKLVPVKPTIEMLRAGTNAESGDSWGMYRAMVAASPPTSEPPPSPPDERTTFSDLQAENERLRKALVETSSWINHHVAIGTWGATAQMFDIRAALQGPSHD